MIDCTENILLCDTSYFIFYRYYAILNWYKKQNDLEAFDVGQVLENKIFMDKYNYTFEKVFKELCKSFDIIFSNVIFAKDCCRENIWRLQYYENYKKNRDDKSRTFNGDIFKHTYNTLLPMLQEKYNFNILSHPYLEADDLVALSVNGIRNEGHTCNITIITNDNDYVQLYNKNVDIYNLQYKALKDRVSNTESYLQYKIILGDKSDNIPSIGTVKKRIGEKTAQKMIDDPSLLSQYLRDDEINTRFQLNELLISFDKIPEQYKNEFEMILKNIILKI
jgi:5'-3' exonuclease